MSIVALALRICATRALVQDFTLAGERVYDSAFLPVDKLTVDRGPKPLISISTEDENDEPAGRDLNAGSRTIDLLIETAIAQTVELPAQDEGGGAVAIQVVDTDATLELSLAILNRQIVNCLWGRGGGSWGKAFRALAGNIQQVQSRRGIPTKDGQRFAARQTAYVVNPIAEPMPGQAPAAGTALDTFLAALAADAKMADIERVVRRAIEGKPVGWPEFYTASAVIAGLTEDDAHRMGIADLGGADSQSLQKVTVQPDGWTLDDVAAEDQLPEVRE